MRVIEITVLALAGLALPGLLAIAVAPPPPNAYDGPLGRVSASSAWVQEGFDTAFLTDGVHDQPGSMWASQHDTTPWVKLELAQPGAVQRLDVYPLAGRKGVRPAARLTAECDGESFELTPVESRLSVELGRPCAVIVVRARLGSPKEKIGIAELEVIRAAP
jgi:hypothetical protein